MSTKASSPKKHAKSKATPAKGKAAKAKASWAETMKNALGKKQPAGGFPDQPKPRDSGVPRVRKNAF